MTVSPRSAEKGDSVTITVKPDSGYQLDDLTVTDKNGKELKLTDKGNGKYTFTMPASKVEVNATFVKEVETSPFSDVSTSAYYYEAVKWAQEKGITGGIGNGLFGPNQPCTRAQIVTFLWRAAGSPEPKAMSSFADVSTDAYYAKAVAWAVENGITTGTGDGKFSPDATCTRAQSVTFLFRAIGKLVDSKAEFSDVLTDSYYANAVAWAVRTALPTASVMACSGQTIAAPAHKSLLSFSEPIRESKANRQSNKKLPLRSSSAGAFYSARQGIGVEHCCNVNT